LRLDAFLKRVGLIRQRTVAKQLCDAGAVSVDGKRAKAGKEIGVGRTIALDLDGEFIEVEVLDLPAKNYKRKAGEIFYRVIVQECKDPLS
jgi:ribosomal 50S subunit-recycling heat shock protein